MINFFIISFTIIEFVGLLIVIIHEPPFKNLAIKLKVKQQDKLFHRYCERCRDYNCIDCRKMTTCQGCRYGECYPKRENNYFRERVR
jgi:hypothetical protein